MQYYYILFVNTIKYMEYRIGFKGKYWKLYEFTIVYKEVEGKTYKYDYYKFVKNISMNKEKAAAKYPEAIFDEFANDRKYTTFWKRELVVLATKFHCGKYAGKNFEMCDDYDYMKWFYNNCATDEQKPLLEDILFSNKFVMHEGQMISNEKLDELNEREARRLKSIEKLEKNIPFITFMAANIKTDGTYFDKSLQVTLKFDKYRCCGWDDFCYGMPIDYSGKARRIKGKQILVLQYVFDGEVVTVMNWKFA